VQVPDSTTLKPSRDISVGLWLKPTRTYTNGTAYFLSKRPPGGSTGYSLGYENGALAFTICASGAKTLRYTCALTSAVPLHVAGTFSSSGHRLYINGALSAETNYDWETGFATLGQGTNALRLGSASGSTPTNFFAGLLDDVRVFDNDITSNEMNAVYELGADLDGDGLSNFDEYHAGTCPSNSDSDADGMLDNWEVQYGLNPILASDAMDDKDGDGYLNIYEAKWGSNPDSTNSVPAPTYIVTNGVSTIQGAITSATQDYAIIKLLPVTYTGTNNVNVDFLGKRLMVTGSGTNTIIDGQNLTLTRGFLFRTGEGRATVLHNLLIRKMEATFGPLSTSGGGLWCSNASPTIYNCRFNQCNAYGGGGLAFVANSSPMVRACRLWGNVGPYEGAAIMVMGGEAQFRDCEITGNGTNVVGSYHTTLGGGVYISGGNPTFSNCTLSANNATLGGGAYWYSEAGSWLGGLVISNNTQGPFDTAGGMLLSGDITVSNTLIAFNSVNGAGVYPDQDTGVGGGLACYGNVRVFDSVVSSNSISRGRGAGVYLVSGTNSHPVIQGCSISGNSITTRGSGGGVAMSSSPWPGHPALASVIRGCSVVENRTASDGGGLSADSLSVGAVESSYIGLNLSTNGLGGGVYSEGNIILQNCTVVSNQAGAGGGLYVGAGTNLTVRNTIVWNNTTNQISMTNGSSVALSYSCVKGGFAGGTAVITNNPRLFAGYRLFNQNSPCVDAGTTNGLPETDLDGKPRLSGAAPDIGCDEFVMIDTDSDGMFDDWENWFFGSLSQDGTGDYDGDRVTDGQEYAQCTDPASNVDTDLDSLSDDYETYIGTDPGYWDSDGDGMSDGWEDEFGLDPLSPDDPNLDSDNDGWTDGQEADQNTDPFEWDTDGDGVPDSVDADPLDPTNSDEATPENSCYLTLMVGDSSGSHTELYGMQLDSYRLFMSYVNSSEFIFTKTIRLPRGHTYEGYIEALGDGDNDGDYDADVTSEDPGVTIIDPYGYLGGHHENTGFNSGRRAFQVTLQSTAANTNVASNPDVEHGCTIDPINTQNGNVTLSETDILVPCPGVSLAFRRHYNSRSITTTGLLGPCWAHSYDILLQSRSNTQYKGTSGNWRRLSLPAGQELWFQDNGDGTFQNPPDSNLRLTIAANGWLVTLPGDSQLAFDTNGVLGSIADTFSNRVTLTYSGGFPNHKLSRVEHLNGQYLDFSYAGTLLTNIVSPVGSFNVQFGYNSSNELTRAIKNVGGTCYTNRFLYDTGTHSLTQRVNAAGDQFNYGYEYTTNLLGQTISRGISMALAPNYFQHAVNYTNAGDNATEVTYSRNGATQSYVYKYDPVINMVKAQLGPGGTNLGTRYTISGRRDITQETQFDDTIGEYFKTLRSYDTNHNVTFLGFAYNATSTTNWTAYTWSNNLPTSAKDAEGALVEFEYTNGRLKTAKAYVASNVFLATRYDYTSNGLLASVTNANGHWQRFGYDAYGFMTSSVPQLGPSVRFDCNRLGFVTNVVTPWISGTRATRIGVTALGWVTNIVYPDGLVDKFQYDSLGNLTNQVDRAGRTNRLTWLPTGKPASVSRWLTGTSPTNVTLSFAYDNQFNTLKITDPMGRAVECYALDLQDRPVAVTNLAGQAMAINWGVGNYVRSITRFDGSVVSNSYDVKGLLVQVSGQSFTNVFSYYRNGALKTAVSDNSTVANSFDLSGRLTAQQAIGEGWTNTVAYQLDPVGNVTNVVISNTAVRFGWTFDAAERPSTLTAQAASNRTSLFQWTYNTNNGLVASVTNVAVSEYLGYDVLDRATNLVWRKADGTTNRNFGYTFGAAGMITNVMREDGTRTAYTYDSLDRLTSEKQYTSGGSLSNSASWTYDLAGNRTMAITNSVTNLYTYASGNRVTNFGPNTLVQYDLAGNTTNLQYSTNRTLALTWDGHYQLTEVRTNGVVVEKYSYDPLGRRVRIVAGATTNTLVYDGPHVVAEWSNNVLARSYAYGPGIDDVRAMTTYGAATNTYFYLKDHLGSVHALVTTNGTTVEQYRYTAWGETTVLSSNGTVLAASAYGNRFTWQGREFSWKTGLHYFRARSYDPVTGRWLSNDPIGISGGLNQYVFCANNPVNFTDPFGLCTDAGGTGFMDWMHGILDVGGTFEPTPFCDLINAALYGFEGEGKYALVSLAGTLPYLGDLGKGGKYGGKIWSATKKRNAVQNAFEHWKTHGAEFPELQNAKQYVERARRFVRDPPPGTLTRTRPNGDRLFYDPKSNTFAVQNANGSPRTMFRPDDGIGYWNRQ
jgi:RHS repeat-associated protein